MSKPIHSVAVAVLAAPVLVLILAAATVQADTITVCWDSSGDYLTIQEGIDAASDGDEVVVCDGVYTGPLNKNLDFGGRAITVRSENGPDNCTIDCEGDGRGFSFTSGETQASVVDGFTITNGYVTGVHGGGIFCEDAAPTIANCVITGNTVVPPWSGGGIMLNAAHATITNCIISGNTGTAGGGIFIVYRTPVPAVIANCTISGNAVTDEGGGIFMEYTDATITNCTFTDNTANGGAGIFLLYGADAVITNCTFSRNVAAIIGGGFYGEWATYATITNCIFWADSPNELEAFGGPHWVCYCDVQGGWPWGGPGNINANPRFVDPGGGDFHLSTGSPCIDVGDPAFVPQPGETDMDGQMRVWDGDGNGQARVDMGADEFGSYVYGDLNCNGELNAFDIDPFVLALTDPAGYVAAWPDCDIMLGDCNGDSVVDAFDIDPFVELLIGG